MWRSCLLLLAVFASASFLEQRELDRRGVPVAWLPALVLAAGVTLTLGSMQGLIEAWRTRSAPESDPTKWKDGQTVRVAGVVRAAGVPLRAPFSGREAVTLWYNATAQHWKEANSRSRPSFRGVDQVSCSIETAAGRVALAGTPNYRLIPEEQFSSPEHMARAARHVAGTSWKSAPDIWTAGSDEAGAVFSASPGGLPANLMNRLASEALGLEGDASDEEQIRRRLTEQGWLLRERVLAPGLEATVVGTFRLNPRRVDVTYGPTTAQHGITPGGAAATASRNLSAAVVFLLVLALLTTVAHFVVFREDGALYRQLIERAT